MYNLHNVRQIVLKQSNPFTHKAKSLYSSTELELELRIRTHLNIFFLNLLLILPLWHQKQMRVSSSFKMKSINTVISDHIDPHPGSLARIFNSLSTQFNLRRRGFKFPSSKKILSTRGKHRAVSWQTFFPVKVKVENQRKYRRDFNCQ